jgi:hypothetical protein
MTTLREEQQAQYEQQCVRLCHLIQSTQNAGLNPPVLDFIRSALLQSSIEDSPICVCTRLAQAYTTWMQAQTPTKGDPK